MNETVEFLRARLDEDEAAAQAATDGPWRHDASKHHREPGTTRFSEAVFAGAHGADAVCVATTGESDDLQSLADADHIARHDPARVLRAVAAKRRLIAEFENLDRNGVGWHGMWYAIRVAAGEYSDHPDYQQEWSSWATS